MSARSGPGIGRVTPTDIERLPDEGIQCLCDLFRMIEEGLSWPWRVTCVVGKLLGKKSGGGRVIGLIAMLCRVWSMAGEEQMKERSAIQAETDHWGAAIAGSSALRE
eukprot:4158887-Pyramimonas_sp.AAC.1